MPKPDRDSTKKENQRLMSLININAKTLNKISTNRNQHNPLIAYHDQRGFIPGMYRWLTIRKSMNTTHHINRSYEKIMILSVGHEKAFNKMQYSLMIFFKKSINGNDIYFLSLIKYTH